MFNKYFQDELAYLREQGREFASAYPALGPMLADRGGDPDVERLLEGFAFLTGRIRQKLDDELPELMHAVSELLFPHLLRPLPGAAILELTPLPNAMRERRVIPAGAEFNSVPVDGTPCRFRSSMDCELVPWSLSAVRLEALPGGAQQLRLELALAPGLTTQQVAPAALRLHFGGELRNSLILLAWLCQHTRDVVLVGATPGSAEVSLGSGAIRHVGFEESEALLPFGETAFPGYRLLEEYYTLPSKFAFVDIAGIRRAAELGPDVNRLGVLLRFDRPLPELRQVGPDMVQLHCVPVLNVFETTAEPIRVTPEREQFLLRPAGLEPGHGEVYAVTQVQTIARGSGERVTLTPFFDFSHAAESSAGQRVFYSTHLRPSVVGDGADLYISLGTAENSGLIPDVDVLSVDLLATNGKLANAVRAGEINGPTTTSPPFASFRNLHAVTPHVPPPMGRDLQWRATAHAAMNLRVLTEPDVLRTVLSVYNFHSIVDRQAARANELRIAALKDIRVSAAERLFRGSAVRGASIEVDLDESGFSGDGDLYLFGCVLDRLFAEYVSLNTFSATRVQGVQTKQEFAWPARSGNLTLL